MNSGAFLFGLPFIYELLNYCFLFVLPNYIIKSEKNSVTFTYKKSLIFFVSCIMDSQSNNFPENRAPIGKLIPLVEKTIPRQFMLT